MAHRLNVELSESVWRVLKMRQQETGEDLSRVIDAALSRAFSLERHSLFQVSTSNALVKGVFGGVTTVGELRRHGDLGLGTFAGFDGELIMLDGDCFRATAGGAVSPVEDTREVPFALVTRFTSDLDVKREGLTDVGRLESELDGLRPSENLFAGMRVDGVFEGLMMRAACPARDSEGLLEATHHQSEFGASGVVGSLVGFWAPTYSRAVSVPGYHFHFISDDRSLGGHVLDLRSRSLRLRVQIQSDLHLAIPETAEFLAADLGGEHDEELRQAETSPR